MQLKKRLLALGASVALATTGAYIGSKEGLSLTPYLDGGGVQTWCYGQTVGDPKSRYTVRECDQDLLAMTREYHTAVLPYLRRDAPPGVHAAFTSLAVNIGKTGWRGSQTKAGWVPAPYMAALTRGDYRAACAAITAPWKGRLGIAKGYKATINGKPSKGLENRRAADRAVCEEGL